MLHRNSHYFFSYINRPDNWICVSCNNEIFGSKQYCLKCHTDRCGEKKVIYLHPSGDWNCPICKFRVSILHRYCNKCNIDMYGEKNLDTTPGVIIVNSDIEYIKPKIKKSKKQSVNIVFV